MDRTVEQDHGAVRDLLLRFRCGGADRDEVQGPALHRLAHLLQGDALAARIEFLQEGLRLLDRGPVRPVAGLERCLQVS
ncbi:hypothetical protein ACFFX0_02645 [Citricoccus parietis]|uniref:Uncharacterized protein n=1 Tax=Citricoccus parietis TaxID=592307 RepID=A0ABV5FTY3_9MICC